MACPIEFNRPKAVSRALVLFWRKGYQATSQADLLAAMNISRSSFYAAFTDKRSFYIECLDLWAARTLELLQRARTEMPPVDALQSFFERSFDVTRGAKTNWGCMLVNTVRMTTSLPSKQFTKVQGHRLAHVEMGKGDPIVPLHGNPASRFLWRDLMPPLAGRPGPESDSTTNKDTP